MRLATFRLAARSRRSLPLRGLAVALCWAAVASMLGAQIHTLAVSHVLCAAHGELEHVRPWVAATAAPDEQATSVAAGEPAASGHEHCAIASAIGRSVSARRVTTVAVRLAAAAVSPNAPVVAPPPLSARATVRLAPKTSPPRA